jgi:UDP-2-acetamido-2,6-beta-L-arabino-hexul-4-ose reductase
MKVLITGANGFLGRNLVAHLDERQDVEVMSFTRDDSLADLAELVVGVDFVFHLAGVNRPVDPQDFQTGNTDLTSALCGSIEATGRQIPVLYTSSSQADLDSPYGNSKRASEEALLDLEARHGSKVYLLRLNNVIGKWARPDYNSVVATFCHNIARDLPIKINDPKASINMVYIDDVITHFIALMDGQISDSPFVTIEPQYSITVGELADQLYAFRDSRKTLMTEAVGTGLIRALYSTYLSYLPPEHFTYEVPKYSDQRGEFVEMLKTRDSGQFSFFTVHPGVTRGGHYHHSKTEKFLVIKGSARFRYCHIVTGEFHELFTSGEKPEIVETVPGWAHDITNVGDDEMIVVLWANENFDRERPDTYDMPIVQSV